MNTCRNTYSPLTRRGMLQHTAAGFGWLAFNALNAQQATAAPTYSSPLSPRPSHFPARAKRVIFLFMQGGPSHLDTFDWKPELKAAGGKTSEGAGGRGGKLLAPQFKFKPRGDSGIMISDLFPELSQHADDLCLLNGMHTSNAAHPQATIALHTGSVNFVRPSIGAWVTYGLGSENQDLPGFITINPVGQGGAQNYGSSFLPASYQGTRVDLDAGGIADIRNRHLSRDRQRAQIDLVQEMNRDLLSKHPGSSELRGDSIIRTSLSHANVSPATLELKSEKASTLDMYGINDSRLVSSAPNA